MHFPISAQPMINAPMVIPGAPNYQPDAPVVTTGAPMQLGCGVVGVGCGAEGDLRGSQLAFGADPDLTAGDGSWPLWLKIGLAVGAVTIIGLVVTTATHRESHIPMRHY